MARRLPGRGSRSRYRRDRFQRAHAHPGSVPGRTDFLSGVHARRTGLPGRVCLCACLLVCLRERVLAGERGIVIVPGRISVGEYVYIRIRVPEPPFVRLLDCVPVLGLAHIRVPDADADHIGIGLAEHTRDYSTRIFSTACIVGACNFGTGRIHAGEHRGRIAGGRQPPREPAVFVPGCSRAYLARAGGPWLCSTFVLSLFHAVVVPSGFSTRVQPQRWMTTW